MPKSNRSLLFLYINVLILLEWDLLPIVGAQGVLVACLPSFKFNVLAACSLALFMLGKSRPIKNTIFWFIVLILTMFPLLLNIIFKTNIIKSVSTEYLHTTYPFLNPL